MIAALPDGTHCVDDVVCRELIARSDSRLSHGAAAQCTTGGEELRTRGTMDGPVHTAAAQQGCIGGVDDRIDGLLGDVAHDNFDVHGTSMASGNIAVMLSQHCGVAS
jgi:hypothetical protein